MIFWLRCSRVILAEILNQFCHDGSHFILSTRDDILEAKSRPFQDGCHLELLNLKFWNSTTHLIAVSINKMLSWSWNICWAQWTLLLSHGTLPLCWWENVAAPAPSTEQIGNVPSAGSAGNLKKVFLTSRDNLSLPVPLKKCVCSYGNNDVPWSTRTSTKVTRVKRLPRFWTPLSSSFVQVQQHILAPVNELVADLNSNDWNVVKPKLERFLTDFDSVHKTVGDYRTANGYFQHCTADDGHKLFCETFCYHDSEAPTEKKCMGSQLSIFNIL